MCVCVCVCVSVCVCVCVHVYVCGGGGERYKNMEGTIYLFVVLVPYVYFFHVRQIFAIESPTVKLVLTNYVCTLHST